MLGRLALLLLVVLAIGLYLPDSRALMADWIRPATEPARRWMTNQELNRIAGDFGIYLGGRGPTPLRRGEFDSWLEGRYPQSRSHTDSWDTRYSAEVSRSTFRVFSAGPDLQFGTADDIVVEGTRD